MPLFGAEKHPKMWALKRLHHESVCFVLQDLQNRTTKPDDEVKQHALPAPEIEARLQVLKQTYIGLKFTDMLEPSHTLINKVFTMQVGSLRYLHWHELTTREAEIRGIKHEVFWKPEANGLMRMYQQNIDSPADTNTEMRLKYALQRRGAACEIGGIMSFSTHELIVEKFFRALNAQRRKDFEKITIGQVADADQEIFCQLARLSAAGMRIGLTGSYPLDDFVPTVLRSEEVQFILMPRQSAPHASGKRAREDDSDSSDRKPKKKTKKQKKKEKAAAQPSPSLQAMINQHNQQKGRSKGSKKGNADSKRTNLPQELVGLDPLHNGKRICFSYNLGGCKDHLTAGACKRGLHICMKCRSESCKGGARNCRN